MKKYGLRWIKSRYEPMDDNGGVEVMTQFYARETECWAESLRGAKTYAKRRIMRDPEMRGYVQWRPWSEAFRRDDGRMVSSCMGKRDKDDQEPANISLIWEE